MTQKTTLNATHRALNARMVDFGGWDMPVAYGSQINEHYAVRQNAGMFDVSHMTVIDLYGAHTRDFLRYLLANDVAKLKNSGQALYSCMLNEQGGVIDDLIVYFIKDGFYRLVVNASTREKDLTWIQMQAKKFSVIVTLRSEFAILAIQGPAARDKFHSILNPTERTKIEKLKRFSACESEWGFVARTGYTGEDGYEIIIPQEKITDLWDKLYQVGVTPCGLGARDTLRLEAGLNLYGQDMNEDTTPFEAGLSWTVAQQDELRDFVGRQALVTQKNQGVPYIMIGLVMDEKGVLRHGQQVQTSTGVGEILSGTFSPTLNKAIAFARIPSGGETGPLTVTIRDKKIPVQAIKYPFVKEGKPNF